MRHYADTLLSLEAQGNLRAIPTQSRSGILDFSTNDYLGLAERHDLRQAFLREMADTDGETLMTSSASRLLAAHQQQYTLLEQYLSDLYGGRATLLFNSGYHANVGLVSALADKHTLIAADKLVHASIIDGIKLSDARPTRWRHNDYEHLARILAKEAVDYQRVIIIAESVYSMDGDRADLRKLIALKQATPNALLYIDEAHALGVAGPRGLGLWEELPPEFRPDIDVVVGTFGKACASFGAYATMSATLRDFAVNRCRSLIFSTALPPICCAWTRLMLSHITTMTAERQHLRQLAEELHRRLTTELEVRTSAEPSHIMPVIIGDPHRATQLSAALLRHDIKVLPIRTPTVPPGTERLRISLSAANTIPQIHSLIQALKQSL